jgi:hypothetical protein
MLMSDKRKHFMVKSYLKTDQRGMGHLGTILLIVVIGGALVGTGYRVHQSRNSDELKVVASTDKTAVRACQKTFHDDDLCKFTGKYNIDNVSYQMIITTTGKDGTGTSTFQSDGRGNTSMSSTINGLTTSFILFDRTSYMKDNSDGSWYKFPRSDNNAPKPTNPNSAIAFAATADASASSNISYKKLGKEACGKLNCFKYQMIDKEAPGNITYFWFDDQDFQLQHYFAQDTRGTTDMIFSYQPVSIKAPTPTKDFSGGSFDEQALQAAQAAAAAGSTQQQ